MIRVLGLTVLIAGGAAAHDLFLMPDQFRVAGGAAVTVGVHNGDGFPGSQSPAPRLEQASLHVNGSVRPAADLHPDGTRAVFTGRAPASGHFLATIVSGANIESMRGRSFNQYLEEEGLALVIDQRARAGATDNPAKERYTKYAKTILVAGAGDGGFSRAVGLPLEFIPEKDPFATKAGETLPVRVLFQGRPAAGLQIIAASTVTDDAKPKPIGRTDAEGRIQVPVGGPGQFRLHTVLMEPCAEPAVAEWESYWATLTFEVQ